MPRPLKFVCISDTHRRHDGPAVPDGDVLIHAGDLTSRGSLAEVAAETNWLRSFPHQKKILIAGNHDFAFQRSPDAARALCDGLIYLEDSETVIEGIRIWGSPWQPWFYDWAFNLKRGPEIRAKWDLIPVGIDVLITHGPPMGIGDLCDHGARVGCEDLLETVRRIRPKFHIFGHIHEDHGQWHEAGTTFINACTCNLAYRAVNPPVTFEFGDGERG